MVAFRRICTSLLLQSSLGLYTSRPAFANRIRPRTASAMAALDASEASVEVQCFCGKVALAVTGPPSLGRSFCHCSICRRLSGSPFSANGLWPAAAVSPVRGWDEATGVAVQVLATSKHVSRVRCGSCGGPVKADLMGGKAVALPLAAMFSAEQLRADGWRVEHHLHYGSRVVDVADDLPKYSTGAKSALWVDDAAAAAAT